MWELLYLHNNTKKAHISRHTNIFTYAFYSNNKPVCLNTMDCRHFTNTNWWTDLKYKTLFWAEIWKINAHGNLCILLVLRSRIMYFKLIHTQTIKYIGQPNTEMKILPWYPWKEGKNTNHNMINSSPTYCVCVTYLTDWLKYFIYGEFS